MVAKLPGSATTPTARFRSSARQRPLKMAMAVGSVSQTIEVSAESPLIDPRKTTTTTNVTLRGAAADPVVARSVGRPADGARRHRRPRERRRRRVRPAVELSGEGRRERRQHLEHRRHRDHRHVGARFFADVLRLRHVPGDERHDRRRGSLEPDAGRRAELRAQVRQQHAARLDAHLLRERGHAVEQPARRPEPRHRRHDGQGQPHQGIPGLRLRARWSAVEGSPLGVGRIRQDRRDAADAAQQARPDDPRQPLVQGDGQISRASAPASRTSAATNSSTAAAPVHASARDDVEPERPDCAYKGEATSSSAATCS